MKKGVLIIFLGRIFIIIAIILSIINIYYWKNNLIDILSIVLASISLIIVVFFSSKFYSDISKNVTVLNEAMINVQLLNIVYKSVIKYDFESLPLSAEKEVNDKLPMITMDQIFKTYNYILTIPKDIKVYLFKDVMITKDQLKSEEGVKSLIKNKYPWMDDESLDLTFNYFFN